MKLDKTILVLGILLSAFVFSVSFATLYAQTHIIEGSVCSCTLPIPLLIPTFASFGLLIGLISYSLLLPLRARKLSKKLDLFLDMLDPLEKVVIKAIIENNGKVSQASISRKIGKLKAFRVLQKLKSKGIIEKEKFKKTNMIILKEKFKKLLSG